MTLLSASHDDEKKAVISRIFQDEKKLSFWKVGFEVLIF
jgi:hypothetical protein